MRSAVFVFAQAFPVVEGIVENVRVGALIGSSGSNIKNMISKYQGDVAINVPKHGTSSTVTVSGRNRALVSLAASEVRAYAS